jgi:LytR cell envelope-related transcriptional attenuator
VNSPAPASVELIRPWRVATLVASGLAALELVLLVVCGLILAGRSLVPNESAAAKPARAAKAAPAAKPAHHAFRPPARVVAKLPRSRTGVLILNGNGVSGAAAQAAALIRARGYLIKEVGNAPRTGYPTWRLMYGPGYAGEAKRFGKDLRMPTSQIGPLDGMKPRQLHGGQLVLILGSAR